MDRDNIEREYATHRKKKINDELRAPTDSSVYPHDKSRKAIRERLLDAVAEDDLQLQRELSGTEESNEDK